MNGGKLDDPAYANRLYRQQADGTFADVTARAGLLGGPNIYGMGAATADIDNDGNGTFTATAEAVLTGWAVSAAFLDYDNDGRLDLFVARYLDWALARNILCGTPFYAYCRPDKFNGVSDVLFHNEGEGRFRDVSRQPGIAAVTGMGVAVNDYDGDGFSDIFVANCGLCSKRRSALLGVLAIRRRNVTASIRASGPRVS